MQGAVYEIESQPSRLTRRQPPPLSRPSEGPVLRRLISQSLLAAQFMKQCSHVDQDMPTSIFTPTKQRSATIVIAACLISTASNLPTDTSALESSISALESSITALDNSSGCWERLFPLFTALVFVGVAMEIIVVLHDHKDDLALWGSGIIRPPARPSAGKLALEIASVVLVSFGILGELGVGLWITHINGQLRTKNSELRNKSDQLLALVTNEAGDAKNSANVAAAAAFRANKAAEQAEEKLAQIVAAFEPRSLSKKDLAEIREEVRPFAKPSIRVLVKTKWNPPRLAFQILGALKDAGFDADIDTNSPAVTPEVGTANPMEYLGPGKAMEAITGALAKKVHLVGATRILPAGSPITIYVGDRIPGKLPK
jgi:hypothetical protein